MSDWSSYGCSSDRMAVALRAAHLGAAHSVGDVAMFIDGIVGNRAGEARPAAARIIFRAAVEQQFTAAGTAILAVLMIIPIASGKGRFGAGLAQHMILFVGQALAPFLFGHVDSIHGAKCGL